MEITKDIIFVGVNDHDVDLFEGHYIVPEGMAYNSYLINDEKVAIMDTVDAHFTEEWIGNIKVIRSMKTHRGRQASFSDITVSILHTVMIINLP